MDRITDAFVWPFRDPDWLAKIVIIGLILIVPVVGAINGLGWMLTAIDRLRSGDEKLPPANFYYLGRGIQLFVVNLVYALVVGIVAVVLFVPAVAVASAAGRGSANVGLVSLGILLNVLVFSLITLASLVLVFAMPAIILATDRAGMAGGLNVAEIVRKVRATPINTLIAGLMLIAASFVGQLGTVLCLVGVLFTGAYALAMQAWIVHSYELGTPAPAQEP